MIKRYLLLSVVFMLCFWYAPLSYCQSEAGTAGEPQDVKPNAENKPEADGKPEVAATGDPESAKPNAEPKPEAGGKPDVVTAGEPQDAKPDTDSARQPAPATSSWERYKVITENNIFLRNRSLPARRTVEVSVPVRSPGFSLRLTGIVRQGKEYMAFIENTRTGTTSRVRVNDSLAEIRIVKIALDHIEFEKESKTTKVQLGEKLDGGSSTQTSASASANGSPGGTQTTSKTGTADERTLLEKLRQRRQKELGK